VTDFDRIDFFSDQSIIGDPYPYFEYLRQQCPVWREPRHGMIAVTGYEEAAAVYRDPKTFSSINSSLGPFPPLPFTPEGDDISELIEAHREKFPMSEHLVSFDPPRHTEHRALLSGLFTPSRLKQNEEFMWQLADRLLDEFIADGRCELIGAYGQPFPLLVIADLLGVPEADHPMFRALLTDIGEEASETNMNPIAYLDKWFTTYIEDRRRDPRDDMLTELATATFSDGSIPEAIEIVRLATFLFIAGHETTTRLLASSLHLLAERPELQESLLGNRELIPDFIEEMLRLESPIKVDFRLTQKATTLGGVDLAPGTTVMLVPGGANRDPRRFECPAEFRPDRKNVRQHLAFGRGIHSCPGGPLARIEATVSLNRILDRMTDIRISEAKHGPPQARHFEYVPIFMLRGLSALHLEFSPRETLS
jgi:cytochrome P450